MVYLSASLSLAVLERLVHTYSVRGLAGVWVYSVDFEDGHSLYLPEEEWPQDWARKPVPPDWHAPPVKATQAIGNDWVVRGASLLLRVPSVVVPAEHNYLLNPAHSSFNDVVLTPPEKFRFDGRLAGLVEAQSRTFSELNEP